MYAVLGTMGNGETMSSAQEGVLRANMAPEQPGTSVSVGRPGTSSLWIPEGS